MLLTLDKMICNAKWKNKNDISILYNILRDRELISCKLKSVILLVAYCFATYIGIVLFTNEVCVWRCTYVICKSLP